MPFQPPCDFVHPFEGDDRERCPRLATRVFQRTFPNGEVWVNNYCDRCAQGMARAIARHDPQAVVAVADILTAKGET